MDKSFIVATAGHVDHGKSALVRALTGTDPDRLPEEKRRGITIDLGFAQTLIPASNENRDTLRLGIVDVPGHEDFVQNMVAGVGSVDLALVVIAADDGWMPQTEEHVQILTYLGVTRAVIALTKMDRAPRSEAELTAEVRTELRQTPFAGAEIVPVSVVQGKGMAALTAAMARVLANAEPARDRGKPRLWIDRAFMLRGIGSIVTGTLTGGGLRVGDTVRVEPRGVTSRIRSLQSHNAPVTEARPGTRTAMNLVEVATTTEQSGSHRLAGRGDVVISPGLAEPSRTLDVWLSRLPRAPATRRMQHDMELRVHVGSTVRSARLILANGVELRPGESEVGQLRLETPLLVFLGDHLILRDAGERVTLAGGRVLDAAGDRKRFHRAPQQNFLAEVARAEGDCRGTIRALLRRDHALKLDRILRNADFSALEIESAVQQLCGSGVGLIVAGWLVDRVFWQAAAKNAREVIADHHRIHPAQLGLPLVRLRATPAARVARGELFDALVDELIATDCERVGAAIKIRRHRPELSRELEGAVAVLRGVSKVHPIDPPSRKELVQTRTAQEALQFLLKTGEFVEVGSELVMPAAHYRQLCEVICDRLAAHPNLTVSEIRQAVGTSRRVIVPLLEKLDREGTTCRDGDRRRLDGRSQHAKFAASQTAEHTTG